MGSAAGGGMGVGGRRTSAQQGELGVASGLERQQAWSPEPSRTPVLRSGHVGQVTFDTQQGCSLVLVTTWFSRYKWVSHAQPWGALSRAAAECGQLMMVKLPLLLFLLQLQLWSCRESSPTLTGGLSFPCLEAPAFLE